MRKTIFLVVTVLLLGCLTAAAQRAELYGGYGYLRFNSGGSTNFNGWDAGLQWNLRRRLALGSDFSGTYSTENRVSLHHYTFLVGPRVSQHAGRLSLFGEAMIGAAQLKAVQGTQSDESAGFAAALGGGADVKLNSRVSYRIAHLDYVLTHLGSNTQNNAKFTTGVVWHF